jgi:hypothetical protein
MCWQCDHPDKTIHDYLDVLRSIIRTRGWAVQHVESERMPFSYTVGMHRRGLPEFLVTGLPPPRAGWLLNAVVKRALTGTALTPGRQVRLPAGALVEVVDVEHPDAHLAMAFNIEGPDVHAVQLVWADAHGRWPWAPGFADGRQPQAVLGVRAA